MEFGKPIVIVVEQEERFWAFDIARWERDECTRTKEGTWTSGWLSRRYAECPAPVRELIKTKHESGEMIPFRRREYEVEAIVREIIRRAHETGKVAWGSILPPRPVETEAMNSSWCKHVCLIFDHEDSAASASADSMRETITKLAPGTTFVDKQSKADKVLVLLTGNFLESEAVTELSEGIDRVSSEKSIIYVYLEGWDWGKLYGELGELESNEKDSARLRCCLSIQGHEAISHRGGQGYEHEAMCLRIVELLA